MSLPHGLFTSNAIELVGTTGFEPATSRTPSERATRLRYVPKTNFKSSFWPADCQRRLVRRQCWFDFNISRSDYYWVAVSSYKNRDYDPFMSSSGPGGNTGSYTLGISLQDAASLQSNLTKQGAGDLLLSANTSTTNVNFAAGSLTGGTAIQAGTLNATVLATPLTTSATSSLYVGGATSFAIGNSTSPTLTITGSLNPLLGTTGSDQSATGTSTLDESLVDAVLEEPTSLA